MRPLISDLLQRYKEIDKNEWSPDMLVVLDQAIKSLDWDDSEVNLEKALRKYAESHGVKNVENLADGEMKRAILFLLGEEWSHLFCEYLRLEAKFPFETGPFRRALRNPNVLPHIRHIAWVLKNFILMSATGFPPTAWLGNMREFKEVYLPFDDLYAVLIHCGNREAIDFFKGALTSETNHQELDWDHFRAISKSGHEELLELEGKLLLAARLQEGLRQAIMETADEGVPDSYIHILKVVKDNDLQRFAAIKRGFAVTTGLSDTGASAHITQKTFDLMYTYLTNLDEARKDVCSKDVMKVYLSLWAIGFYNVEDMKEPILHLIREGSPHQIGAALILLGNIRSDDLNALLAAEALRLHYDDLGVVAGAIPLYLGNFYSMDMDEELALVQKNPDKPAYDVARYLGNVENALKDFEILGNIYDRLQKKLIIDPYVFPWYAQTLTKDSVATKLCKLAQLIRTPEIVDRTLKYISGVDSYYRDSKIKILLSYPTTQNQVDYLIENMGSGSEDAKKEVCLIVERLFKEGKLKNSDIRKMENLLRLKASETRVAIIRILGELPDKEAEESARRLLKDKVAMRRLAGLEIVKHWNDKKKRLSLVEALKPDIESISQPDAQEKKMISGILGTKKDKGKLAVETYSMENGFGLYDPNDNPKIAVVCPADFNAEKALAFENPKEAIELMKKLMKLIEKNADLEFKNNRGETYRIGNSVISLHNCLKHRVMKLAYPEIWLNFFKEEIKTTQNLLRLALPTLYSDYRDKTFLPVIKKILGKAYNPELYREIEAEKYYNSADCPEPL